MIDEYILDLNQLKFGDKQWRGIGGIGTSLGYEAEKEEAQKDFDERFLLAQKPTRGRF